MRSVSTILAAAAAAVLGGTAVSHAATAKNVLLFISDGAGFNHFNAGAMYQYGFGNLPYEGPGWTKFAATTYPLNLATSPTGGVQDPNVVYSAAKTWDATPETAVNPVAPNLGLLSSGGFKGYNFTKTTFVDSASAGTQIASGVKSYNNAINWTNSPAATGTSLSGKTIAEIAKANNFATGVVASVYFSHATPATTGGAHNINRNNLQAIANEMLTSPTLDVILSPGNPEFDDAGKPTPYAPANASNIGGDSNWQALKNGTHPAGWDLITSKGEFEAIANGTQTPPQRLIGITETRNSLQYNRPFTTDWDGNGTVDNAAAVQSNGSFHQFFPQNEAQRTERQAAPINPGDNSAGEAFVSNVPTLETMTKTALKTLQAKSGAEGVYLMVEGAHIDWAGHGHDSTRLIEEQADFNNAIEAGLEWVAANDPDFSETLFIVTADHECGMLWGPSSDSIAFDPIRNNGIGNKPGMRMNSSQHTNQFVPLYARGVGADQFAGLIDGVDNEYLARYGMSGLPGWGNGYIDITDMFTVMNSVVPEPSAFGLLSGAALVALRRTRR
jgi:alkaline phosphatase